MLYLIYNCESSKEPLIRTIDIIVDIIANIIVNIIVNT